MMSAGPNRKYDIAGKELTFKHTAVRDSGFRLRESALLVQGLKVLGPNRITHDTTTKRRAGLPHYLRAKVFKDTGLVTGWIREAILDICRAEL